MQKKVGTYSIQVQGFWIFSFKKFSFHFYLMCICVCATYRYPQRSEEGTRSSRTWAIHCGGWELNWGPLKEYQMLLTAEPFLQPLIFFCYICICVYVVYVHVHMNACLDCRGPDLPGCMHTWVHVEACGSHWVTLTITIHLLCWGKISYWHWSFPFQLV